MRALALAVLVPLGLGIMMLGAPEWDQQSTTIGNVAVWADGRFEPYVSSDAPVPPGGSIGALTLVVERTYIGAPWAIAVRLVPSCQYVPRSGSTVPVSQAHIDRFAVPALRELLSGSSRGSSRELDARAAELFTDMSPRWVVWWPGVWRPLITMLIAGVFLFAVSYPLDRVWWTLHSRNARARACCPVCDYSLKGLTSPTCPECGHEVEKQPPK